jgi:hypothetical protein
VTTLGGKGEVPQSADQLAGRLQLDIANYIRRSAGIATGAILLRDGEILPTEQALFPFGKCRGKKTGMFFTASFKKNPDDG